MICEFNQAFYAGRFTSTLALLKFHLGAGGLFLPAGLESKRLLLEKITESASHNAES